MIPSALEDILRRGRLGGFIRRILGNPGSLRAQLVLGASGTLVLKVASTGFAFITSLVLARLLGAEGYGVYAYAISWAAILTVPAMMGLPTLLTRDVARYKAKGEWGALCGILRWSDRMVLLVSFGLALPGAGVIWLLRGDLETQISTALWVAMAILPLLAFIQIREGGLRGLGRVVKGQLPQMLVLPVLFLILVSVLHFTFGLSGPSAVGMRALAAGVAFLVAAMLLGKYLPGRARQAVPEYRRRDWLKSAFPLLFAGAAAVFNQEISIVMVGSMVGAEAAGIFSVAARGAMLVGFPLVAISLPFMPAAATLHGHGETEKLQKVVTKSARAAFLGSIAVTLALIVFRQQFLLLFGQEFVEGGVVLILLSLGRAVEAGMGLDGFLLNMTGREIDNAKGTATAAIINVMLQAILIPVWNIKGAAVAASISVIIGHIFLTMWAYKRLGIYSTALGQLQLTEPKR